VGKFFFFSAEKITRGDLILNRKQIVGNFSFFCSFHVDHTLSNANKDTINECLSTILTLLLLLLSFLFYSFVYFTIPFNISSIILFHFSAKILFFIFFILILPFRVYYIFVCSNLIIARPMDEDIYISHSCCIINRIDEKHKRRGKY
jgi:uncharacterized protein YqhQ